MADRRDIIQQGALKLEDKALPPLAAGGYTATANVEVVAGGTTASYASAIDMLVEAPTLAFDPALIYSTYPAAGANGIFHESLPHIVLSRKTLPWEARISSAHDSQPWLALLLLTDKEIADNKISIDRISVSELLLQPAIGAQVLLPDLEIKERDKKDESGNDKKTDVVHLPASLFLEICPAPAEMALLTHARQVDVTSKDNAAVNPGGWFSVVNCNRLPVNGERHKAMLVSLQGHSATLPVAPADTHLVRLVVLHSWSFTSKGRSFAELGNELKDNVTALRIDPAKLPGGGTGMPPDVSRILYYGYTPMNHDLRNGATNVSWYRGPLVPADIPVPGEYIYNSADSALRLDAATGMLDISYAAAWQLGRLLALQNTAFTTALNNWKAAYRREKPLAVARNVINADADTSMDDQTRDRLMHVAEADELLADYMLELYKARKAEADKEKSDKK